MSKIQGQEKWSTMNPPTGGPTTGPISAGADSHAMAATSSDFAAVRSSSRRPTGTIMAPPMPCRMRAPTRNGSVSARPHSTEPKVNTRIAARNTVRAPKRSAIHPLMGMNTARLSRYDVRATFIRTGSSPNARAMVGNAVEITVLSRFCMNSAQATISAVVRARLGPMMPDALPPMTSPPGKCRSATPLRAGAPCCQWSVAPRAPDVLRRPPPGGRSG